MSTSTTEKDFFEIKNNLKTFLKSQSEFADYNFEGSAMATLLDVLAYNTHYNAITAKMSVNEMFLDTAQIRSNVVTHAKALGYTPRSVRSSQTRLTWDSSTTLDKVTIPRGTEFNGPDGVKFNTITDYPGIPVNGNVRISDIAVYEGKFITNTFVVGNNRQLFRIPNKSCDTRSISVMVYDDANMTTFTSFSEAKNLIGHDDTSNVYFLQEGPDSYFEIYFGDDIIGKRLTPGNVVEIQYLKSKGDIGNGIKSLTLSSSITGTSNATITLDSPSSGGSGIETIESIKKNAPYLYAAQNRTVTTNDYKSILINNFSFIKDLTAWGGEDQVPPEYGKVFISAITNTNVTLVDFEKDSIIDELHKMKITSIIPEFVEPEYINLELVVNYSWNSTLSSLSGAEISSKIKTLISDYNNTLSTFDTTYYNSDITSLVINSDPSVLAATCKHIASKSIPVYKDIKAKYKIDFGNSIYNPHEYHKSRSDKGVILSAGFKVSGSDFMHFLEDDGAGTIKLSYITDSGNVVISDNEAGTANYQTGEIIINSISVSSESLIINAELNSYDVIPHRNNIIRLSNVIIENTPVSGKLSPQSSKINYQPTAARL